MIKSIRKMEKKYYPRGMRQMQDCRTLGDLAEYCEVPKERCIVLQKEGCWYIILADHGEGGIEIVDVCGSFGMGFLRAMRDALSSFRGRECFADLRAATTGRLLRRVRPISFSTWWWGEEKMIRCRWVIGDS